MIVATAILAMSFSVVMSGMSTSLRTTVETEALQRRIDFARLKMAEIDLVSALRVGDSANGLAEDGITWRIEVEPYIPAEPRFGNQAVVRVVLTLEWVGRTGRQTWTTATYRSVPPAPGAVPPLRDQLNAIG